MRILFLTQTYPRYPADTAGPFIREIARGMIRAGDEVTILVPHTAGLPKSWVDCGIQVESFRYAPEALEKIGYSRSLEKDETVKIVSAIAAPLYLVGARRAVTQALAKGHARNQPFDVFHAHWIVPNGIACNGIARAPQLQELSGGGEHTMVMGFGLHGSDVFLAERPVVRGLVRRSMASADFLTGCSPELVERISRLGTLGGKHACTSVIPYGIDAEVFSPGDDGVGWRARFGIEKDATVVLGVGRMATKKGFQVLLEVAGPLLTENEKLHIVLAGGGDREAEFRTLAEAHAGRIHFPGIVERDQLADLYRSADIFCLPAVHDEKGNVDGLPNVILEAMATGLPVVSTEISGIPLAVVPEETGLLVAEQDAKGLLAALATLADSSELAKQYGAAGRRRAVSEFGWDQTAEKYRSVYQRAMGPNPNVREQGKAVD